MRYICLHETDEYLRDTDELRDKVTDIIREVRADVIFAAPPVDYNLDHTETSRIAFQAAMFAPTRTIRTAHEPTRDYPVFYYMEPIGGVDWQPTHFVDITDAIERKRELLACHESQMKNMTTSSGWDLIEYANIVGRFRGMQCGVAYAESFRVAQAWPRMTARNHILP